MHANSERPCSDRPRTRAQSSSQDPRPSPIRAEAILIRS